MVTIQTQVVGILLDTKAETRPVGMSDSSLTEQSNIELNSQDSAVKARLNGSRDTSIN